MRNHEETISNRDRIKLAQERQKIAEERYREVTKQLEDEKRRNFTKKVYFLFFIAHCLKFTSLGIIKMIQQQPELVSKSANQPMTQKARKIQLL